MQISDKLLEYIKASPTAFHAVDNIRKKLTDDGYTELFEGENWEIVKGGRYFVTRNRSAAVAFSVPENMVETGFMIVASHSDSPCFKVKTSPELDGLYTRINAEKYGGAIHDSWFDRPLSVAGRVTVRKEGGFRTVLVNIDRDLLLIPHVAIHMDNPNNGKAYDLTSDLVPLYGPANAKGGFMRSVAEAAGVNESDIISHELFIYNRQAPSVWGADNEYISSPRLDDLACAFCSAEAICSVTPRDAVAVMFVADNEEVGSSTKQGAGSTFLYDVLSRVCDAFGSDLRVAAVNSMMLSADNAHAVHPNKPALADPTNRPVMGGGTVIKYNASQLYTTDAISSAVLREICGKAGLPLQTFANRSDMRGGSTLGNIQTGSVPLLSVDVGIPQLAMHSSYETCAASDVAAMMDVMKAFYGASVTVRDGDVMLSCDGE